MAELTANVFKDWLNLSPQLKPLTATQQQIDSPDYSMPKTTTFWDRIGQQTTNLFENAGNIAEEKLQQVYQDGINNFRNQLYTQIPPENQPSPKLDRRIDYVSRLPGGSIPGAAMAISPVMLIGGALLAALLIKKGL